MPASLPLGHKVAQQSKFVIIVTEHHDDGTFSEDLCYDGSRHPVLTTSLAVANNHKKQMEEDFKNYPTRPTYKVWRVVDDVTAQ